MPDAPTLMESAAIKLNDVEPPSRWSAREFWVLLALAFGMALLVYREALLPGRILATSDDNIGAMALRARWLPGGFWRAWDDSVLAGQPAFLTLNWTNLLLWLLPLRLFQNAIHGIDLALASVAMGLFFRARGIRLAPAILGALTTCWLGSTFFLTYAGHIGKFGTVLFAAIALWCIEEMARRRSAAWGILAGAACGAMFLEQADVAVFFALALGPYALFAVAREQARQPAAWLRTLVPMGAVALLVAVRALWMAASFFAFETADRPAETREQVWDYCTQWSWPPEETIEWIAPGYFGWRSGEPAGPYWGRLGRSTGWESTGQGFPNFKLETLYIGVIPIALALAGVVLGLRQRDRMRGDILFWSVAAVSTFVLGCGKFTPLYRLFFELTGVSSIRGPVKFMQVTQLALGVLAAYGFNHLLTGRADAALRAAQRYALYWAAPLLLWALWLSATADAATQSFSAAGWGTIAAVIVENRMWSVGHAGFLLLLLALLLWLMRARPAPVWSWALLAVVAVDQWVVSRHYVKTVPAQGYIETNPVVDYLKPRMGAQRLFLFSQGSFYNQWLSVLLPYHGISTYNVAQMRMPEDYREFLAAMGNKVDQLWRHFAVGYVMGPAAVWPQLENDPRTHGQFRLEYAFNVFPNAGGVAVVPGTEQQRGQHILARYLAAAPRYALVAGWEPADPSGTLARLASPQHVPLERVLVPPAAQLPASEGKGLSGSVDVLAYEAGRVTLRVATDVPAILRAGEKFTPYWRARVDHQPVPVFRCDHIFTGLLVGPGLHTVELEHRPPRLTLGLQAVGLLAALGAAFVCARPRAG